MQTPTQVQSNSIIGVLDATFRLYRAHFRALLTGLISVVGAMMLILLMFRSGNHESIDWTHLSPLRPKSLVSALAMLRFGADPLDLILEYADELLLLLCAQILLTSVVLGVVARAYLAPFHMAPPARPRGLRGEIMLVPGVLAALPLSILGALLAQPVASVALLWLDTAEPLDPALFEYVWLNYGGQLLVCLALVALCARLLFAPQIAVLERVGGRASLRRSWQLTRGAFGRVLVAALVVTLVPALLVGSLSLIPYLAYLLTGTIELSFPLLTLATILGQALLALAYVFQIAFFTLLYYDLRFRGEGYDLVMQAHRTSAEQAWALLDSGVAALERDDLSGARADFEQARALLPENRTILDYCIGVKLRLDDPAGALKDCEHALALFPNDPQMLHCRGLARHRLGDLEGAKADYDRAISLFPNEVTALLNRAHLKHTLGDYDDAREDLLWVLQYKPGESAAMYNIACGYARQHKADATLEWLRRAIMQDQRYCAMAREDVDFTALRADDRFVALVSSPGTFQTGGATPEHS